MDEGFCTDVCVVAWSVGIVGLWFGLAFVKGAWYSQVPCFFILWVIMTLSNQPCGTFHYCDVIPQLFSAPSPRQSGKIKCFILVCC